MITFELLWLNFSTHHIKTPRLVLRFISKEFHLKLIVFQYVRIDCIVIASDKWGYTSDISDSENEEINVNTDDDTREG